MEEKPLRDPANESMRSMYSTNSKSAADQDDIMVIDVMGSNQEMTPSTPKPLVQSKQA